MKVSEHCVIPDDELEFSAIRASGPGGQNVNKVSSAVQLRFDISTSSLPEDCKSRLLASRDRRIGREGVIIIKAQRHRSQEQNRLEAVKRLQTLIAAALAPPRVRRATRPSKAARRKRIDEKTRRGQLKRLRTKVRDD